jgi:transmembrane protease serine 9
LTNVRLTITPNSKCSKSYPKSWKLPDSLNDTQLCAGDPVMDTCQGDSGGPLENRLFFYDKLIPFVVGITSFGSSACGSKTPSVYTRVSSYISWIKEIVNEDFDPLSKYQDLKTSWLLCFRFLLSLC